jgi:hypothetical protein
MQHFGEGLGIVYRFHEDPSGVGVSVVADHQCPTSTSVVEMDAPLSFIFQGNRRFFALTPSDKQSGGNHY